MERGDIQRRVLKALLILGNTGYTSEVSRESGLTKQQVITASGHLRSRSLISRKKVFIKAKKRVPPHYLNYYILNEKLMSKIVRLASEC